MASDSRAWINALQPGSQLDEVYVVHSKDVRGRKGGGNFLALSLADKSGEVSALAWDNVESIGDVCEVGAVVRISGNVQRYNQRIQIVVRRAVSVPPDEVDESLFIKSSSIDTETLWKRLTVLIEEVEDQHLRQLLSGVFFDPEIAERFRVAPAAKAMHHAFRSGLLEHTVSMATAARSLAKHYGINESLVVAGALLHDLGKIWELEIGSSIEYTDDGRLLGHMTLEVLLVDSKIKELPRFPAETRRQLLHILLSHHGEYAYGSPRRPKTPEAQLVHGIDTLDARMAGMFEAIAVDSDPEQVWTPYSRILERNIYKRQLPDAEE